MNYGTKVRVTRWGLVLACLSGLEVGPRMGFGDSITVVPFSEMISKAYELIDDGSMTNHLFATVSAFLLSFVIATVTGILSGLLLWRLKRLRLALDPYLTVYYAIPIFVFYPVLLAVLGFSLVPIIVIAWLWAVVAVMLNTAIGLDRIPEVQINVGRSLMLGSRQMILKIYLPSASPYIFTGLKLGMTYSIIGVIASEFVLATRGLGYLVSYNYNNFRTADMYASIVVIFVIAWLANEMIRHVEERLYARASS